MVDDDGGAGYYGRGIEFEFKEHTEESGAFVPSGAMLDSIRSHLRAGEVEHAVELYQSCAQDIGDQLLELLVESSSVAKRLEQMFSSARDFKRAAICSERLGHPAYAARLADQAGHYTEAARLYVAAGQLSAAAQAFLRAGLPEDAARLYHQAGDFALSGEALEMAGDFVGAARAFATGGAESRAISLLQRIDAASPRFCEARLLLGSLLGRLGQYEYAARCMIQTLRDGGASIPQPQALEMLYLLGHAYAMMPDLERCRATFLRIQEFSPGFRDVAQLLAAMPAAAAAPAASSAAPKVTAPAAATTASPTASPTAASPAAPAGGHTFAVPDARSPEGAASSTAPAPAAATASAGSPPTPARARPAAGRLDGFEHLKALPLARDFSLDDLRLLYSQCEQVRMEEKAVLIEEGTPGKALWIVTGGSVDVVIGGKKVATLGPGACVGEMSMVDAGPTSATVVASSAVALFRLDRDRFQRLLDTRPALALSFYRVIVESLVDRVRKANERIRGS